MPKYQKQVSMIQIMQQIRINIFYFKIILIRIKSYIVYSVPVNIRSSVYKYHLQNTYNYYDWFDVFTLYELSGDAQEKNDALTGLTGSRSVWLLNL